MEDSYKEFETIFMEEMSTAGALMDDFTEEEIKKVSDTYSLTCQNSTLAQMDNLVETDSNRTSADGDAESLRDFLGP